MNGNRFRHKILISFRRVPLHFLALGTVIIVLCPFAVLHYSSVGSNGIVHDISVENSDVGNSVHTNEDYRKGRLDPKKSFVKKPQACAEIPINPRRPDFDLTNLTYTLTDLKSDGDRGVWDEEMERKYLEREQSGKKSKAETEPLLVYVVPFSHADPGWLNTVEEYFHSSIKHALDNMLTRLQQWPDMTFIWAETSFFKMWWETIDEAAKNQTRALLKSGRLEIVNGGYVMPDEASCHYYAILHQYVYGHQWVLDNLGVIPQHGFSIDPFGHSATMPYILKNLDFRSMFIQRIHYNLRKHLVTNRASEFVWDQPWDKTSAESMFCHLAPHHLYTIKNICSLSPTYCQWYDFHELNMQFTEVEVKENTMKLLESLRRTGSIYPHNVVLYILGDDFRWVDPSEWTKQYTNYKKMMGVLNSDPKNNIVMKFGTLKDYYDAVFQRMGAAEPDGHSNLPVPHVRGDFFPYADKFEDYWTGYFTSRPYYKQMSRELERDLRTAEMMYTLVKIRRKHLKGVEEAEFHEDLVGLERATMDLGLFQHHDAITGTSKQYVAADYGAKLQHGLLMAHAVILRNVFRIAQLSSKTPLKTADIILDTFRPDALTLPIKSVLRFSASETEKKVFIFNPLGHSRTAVVHLITDTNNLIIEDADGKELQYQISPQLNSDDVHSQWFTDELRVTFYVELNPMAMKAVSVKYLGPRSKKVKIASRFGTLIKSTDGARVQGFVADTLNVEDSFTVSNSHLSATFRGDTGMLETIKMNDGSKHKVEMEFKRYETMASGAYLFRPNGIGELLPYPRHVRLLEGPLYSEVIVLFPDNFVHVYRIYNTTSVVGRSIEMETISSMQNYPNSELIMKLSTRIKSKRKFYTDSNGFQTLERLTNHRVPMSANFYPATTTTFIQDDAARLTIHFIQSQGVGSQRSGELEVMLDRYLLQDDARGVGEPLRDLRIVRTNTWLQLETTGFCHKNCLYKNPSQESTRVNLEANHPVYVTLEQTSSNMTSFEFTPMDVSLPCDTHIVMLKPVTLKPDEDRLGIMLHKLGTDCNSDSHPDCRSASENIRLDKMFKDSQLKSYNQTGLNFVQSHGTYNSDHPVQLKHMTIGAYVMRFT